MTIDITDLTRQLRETDPVATEPPLDPAATARMRRAMLDVAQAPGRRLPRAATFALAASFACVVTLGVVAARHSARAGEPMRFDPPVPHTGITQVHFSTPGGTRVIWTLDPAFDLHEGQR